MRRPIIPLLTYVAIAAALSTTALAADRPAVSLPSDHYGHPGAGIEWWYFTGVVRDPAGTPYSVFFTLFSSRGLILPIAQVRNLESGALVGHTESVGPGPVSTKAIDETAGGMALRYDARANIWSISVAAPTLHLILSQRPEKRYVLHGGGTGVIAQASGGLSHYYSDTRMRATGTLRLDGRLVPVTGESWFDHQWGNYADKPAAFDWNWFSCRFTDHTELMLYQFRDPKSGRPIARYANGTFVAANGHSVSVSRFTATPDGRTLHAAGRTWPIDWKLQVPASRLTERLRALVPDQLVRNTIVPTFWEGATRATGSRSGTCFVELSYR
jgi:predicted secreted hydrolase